MKKNFKLALGILSIAIGLLVVFLFAIYFSWICSDDPKMKWKEFRDTHKMIRYQNQTDSIYTIVTQFKYSENEISKKNISKIDFLSPFYMIDTSYLNFGSDNLLNVSIPIKRYNYIPFPKSFKINIYNESGMMLYKNIDFELFKMIVVPEDSTFVNILDANIWTLVIDSTLLEIN